MTRTVLIADDDSTIRTVLSQAFSRAGYNVRATGLASAAWRWISEGEGDVFVTDVILPDENAFDVLPRIRKLRPSLPVVVISAQNTVMTAIRAAELGAYDYLPKPFDLSALVQVVGRAIEQASRPQAVKQEQHGEALPLVGSSSAMQEIYRIIARLTQTDLTAMIVGESGTGKELVARALHDYSKRRKGAFVAINMAAIPRELIESELFGHEKGAFTGATGRATGRFEQAEGGTLFLDEIGDMPIETQTRLLRVLQQGEFTSVGGSTAIKSNVRIVAATHRDLRQLIDQGLFREDLFFRLNVVPLRLPPLRERLEDIPDLVRHFQIRAAREGLLHKDFTSDALSELSNYRWPGNIRELENLVKRLLAMEVDDSVSVLAVRRELANVQQEGPAGSPSSGAQSLTEFLDGHLARYFAGFGRSLPPAGVYDRFLSELEGPLLRATLTATRGNQIKASELLGINRNTLRSKLKDRQVQVYRGMG